MKKFFLILIIIFILLPIGVGGIVNGPVEPLRPHPPTGDVGAPRPTPVEGGIVIRNPLGHLTLEQLIDAIIGFIFYLALAISPLLIIIGAFYILTAGGDPNRVKTGQNIILYTSIGLAIVMLARVLIAVIKGVIGVR